MREWMMGSSFVFVFGFEDFECFFCRVVSRLTGLTGEAPVVMSAVAGALGVDEMVPPKSSPTLTRQLPTR